jgi:hypothetical protein
VIVGAMIINLPHVGFRKFVVRNLVYLAAAFMAWDGLRPQVLAALPITNVLSSCAGWSRSRGHVPCPLCAEPCRSHRPQVVVCMIVFVLLSAKTQMASSRLDVKVA